MNEANKLPAETSPRLGRPPIPFKPEYCQMLILHMKEGFSFESFAGRIGVSRTVIYDWTEKYKDFADAKEDGEAGSRYFLEDVGRCGMTGKLPGFNVVAWLFTMKNRCNWRDKTDVEHSGEVQGQRSIAVTIVPALGKDGKEC
jgi:hypothetical protein